MDLSACDDSDLSCPLCLEEMDSTDRKFQPCHCGYQICLWCWHHIMEMANKDNLEGRCPACRSPYDKEKIVSASPAAQDEFSDAGGGDKKQKGKGKGRTNFGSGGGGGDIRKHLSNVRVVQRNLVYVVGMPMSLADEETLERREYFGQYGRVLKIAVSRSTSGISGSTTLHGATANVYVTFVKEEDAVRCIQAVDGCIFEGRTLRACFGTTKYCNAWLKNLSCNNPDCLYLHEIGTQEDSYTKEEMLHNKHHQYDAASMVSRRAANGLPPPLDGYSEKASYGVFSSGGSSRGVTSTTAAAAGGKVGGSGGGTSGGLLPAAASWGSKGSTSGKLVLSAPRPFGTSGPAQVAPSPYANANGQVHSAAHGLNGPPSSLHAAAWPPPSSSTMPASSSSLNPSTLSPAIAIPGSVTQMYPYKPSAAVLSGRVIQASAHSPPVFSSGVGSGSGLSNSLGAGGQAVGIRGRSPYRERGRQKSPTASPFGSPPPPSFAMAASTQTSTSLSSTPIRSGGVTVLLRAPDPSLVAATAGLSSRLGSSTATSSGATLGGAQQVLEEATSAGPSNRKGDGIIKQTDSESKAGPGNAKSGGGGKSGAGKAASASSSSSSSSSTTGSSASTVATKSSSSSTSGGSSSSTINSSASTSKSGSSSGATSNASSSSGSGGSSAGSKKSTKSSSLDDVALSAAGGSKKAAKLSSSDDATTNSSTSGRSSSNSSTSMKGGASVSTATATSTTAGSSSSSSSSSGPSYSSTSSSKSISSASSMMSSSNGGKAGSSSSSSAAAATSAAGSSGAVSSRSGKSSNSVSGSAKNASASSSSSSSIGDEEVMGGKGSDGTGATRSSSNAASATSTSSGLTSSTALTKPARGDAAEEGGQPQGAAALLGMAKGKPRVTAAAKAEPPAVKEPESEAVAAASTERGRKKGRVEAEEASTSSSEGKADSCTAESSVADAGAAEEIQAMERATTAEKISAVEAPAANPARGGGAADAAEADAREAASAKRAGGSEEEAGMARALDNAPTADGSALSSTLPVADGAKAPPQAASIAAGKVTATTATLSAPPGFGMRPPRVQQQLALSAQTGSAGEAGGGPALADRPVASVGVSQELRKHEQQHQFHMLAQQTQRQHGVGEPWLVHDSAIVSFSELNVGASAVSNLVTQRMGVASRSDTSLLALEARGLQLSAVSGALPPHPVEGSGRGGGGEGQAAQRHNYVASQPSGLPTSISVPSLLASLGANSLSSLPSLGPAATPSYMALPTISTQGFGVMPVPPLAAATVATPSLPLHARQLPLTGNEASARAGVGLSNLSRALLGLGPRSQLGSVMPEVDESQVIADILQMDAVDELWRLPSLATSSAAAHPTLPAERAVPLVVDTARPEPATAAGGREDSVHGASGSSADALAAAGSSLARVLRSVSLSRSATDAARGGASAGAGGDSQGRNGLLGGGAYAAASGPPKRSRFRFAQTEEEEQGGGVQQDQVRAHSQQLHELLQQQQVEQQLKQLLQQSQQQLKQQPLIEPQQQKGLWAFDVESRSAGLSAAEGIQATAQSRSESAVSQGGVGASQGQLSVPPGFGARRVFSSSPTPPAAAVVAAGSAGPAAGAGVGGVGVVRASSMGSVPQQPLPQPQTGGGGAGAPPVQAPPGFGPARSASAKVWQPQMQQGTSASAGAAASTAAVPFAPPGFALSSSGVGSVAGLHSAGAPAAASTLLSLASSLSHTLAGSSTGSSSGVAATTAAGGWPQDTAIAWTSEQIAGAGLGGQPQLLGASRMYGSRNNLSSIVEGGNNAGTAQSASAALAAPTSTAATVNTTATSTSAGLARSDSQAAAGMYSQPVYRAAASVAAPPPGFSSSADPALALSSSRYAREATLSEWLGSGLGGSSTGGSSEIGKHVMEPLVAATPFRSTEGGLPANMGERYNTALQQPKQQQWLQSTVPKVGSIKGEDQWQVLDQRQQKQQSHVQLPFAGEQEMRQQQQHTRSQQDHPHLQKQQQKQAPQQQGQQGPPGYAWTRSTQTTEPQLEPWQLLPETDAVPLALAGQPGSFVGRLGSAASGAVLLQPRKAASRRGRFGFGLEPEESEMASGKEGAW